MILVTTSGVPVAEVGPGSIEIQSVETAAEMHEAMVNASVGADVVIMAAAVADFRPKRSSDSKVKRELGTPEIVLEPTADILVDLVSRRVPGQLVVGFAAETENVLENARSKIARKGCDLLVVNDVSEPSVGFDHDTNAVTILEADGTETSVGLSSKRAVADAIFDRVWRHLANPGGNHVS